MHLEHTKSYSKTVMICSSKQIFSWMKERRQHCSKTVDFLNSTARDERREGRKCNTLTIAIH